MSVVPIDTSQSAAQEASKKVTAVETVLVVLFGLIAKAALDQAFTAVPHLEGFNELWRAFVANVPLHVLRGCQLVVFFFTLFRFFLGSIAHYELRGKYTSLGPLILDMLLTVILFTGFYLTALAVRHPVNFCLMLLLMHIVDVLWFFLSWLAGPIGEKHQAVLKSFVMFDVFTVGLFLLVGLFFQVVGLGFGPPYWSVWACLVILLVIGIVDFRKHRTLYLDLRQ